jgi:hypothetical protein
VNLLCSQLLLTHESRLSVMHKMCFQISTSRKEYSRGRRGGVIAQNHSDQNVLK